MSLRMIILLAVLGAPYGYLLVQWSACLVGPCRFDGYLIFYTFVGLVALPFVMATVGGAMIMGGARRVAGAAASRRSGTDSLRDGVRGGVQYWIGLVVMLTALPACVGLFYMILDTPEEGRDRLGRICETDGGKTTCRPDPDADRPSELDMINAARKRQRWFEGG
jgi:hypothetical protein